MNQPTYFTIPSDTLKVDLAKRLGYEIVSASWLVESVDQGLWVEKEAAKQQAKQSETTGVMLAEGGEYEEAHGQAFQFELAGGIVLSAQVGCNTIVLHGANYAIAPYPLSTEDRHTLAAHVKARGGQGSSRLYVLTLAALADGQAAAEQTFARAHYFLAGGRLDRLKQEVGYLREAEKALTDSLGEKVSELTKVIRTFIAEGERRISLCQAEDKAKLDEARASRKRLPVSPLLDWVPRPRDYDDIGQTA